MQQTTNTAMTLFELQSLIRRQIDAAHPMPYWVVAEVSEIKVNYSGHCYMELVEKGGDNAIPRAKASAVIWRSRYPMISTYFRTATGNDIASGMKIMVKVAVTYHELYGLSLQITDIEPSYTLGDIQRQRRETIARLQQDGVFDMNRELELPLVLQRIAVVSSRGAAGYQDFMNHLADNERAYDFSVTLYDSFMQGAETENSVVDALDMIADNLDSYDAVVVIRGGGSQSDLAAFDSYRLCSHLAQFPLPVITGIGHDKDTSVADMVAAVALKTPTAVAGFLVEHNSGFEDEMDDCFAQISRLAAEVLRVERELVARYSYQLGTITAAFVGSVNRRIDENRLRLHHYSSVRFERELGRINRLSDGVSSAASGRLRASFERLAAVSGMLPDAARRNISARGRELALLEGVVDSRRPERIMSMGFSVLYSGGRLVRSVEGLAVGDCLDVRLPDGVVDVEIKNIL